MLDWKQLVLASDEALASLDIIETNLACAAGLPGSETIHVALCKDRVDSFARYVSQFTEARIAQFHRKRQEYNNSEAYFRVLAMVTAVQRDLGVRYNQAKIPEDVPLDVEDTFVHGILQGQGGTCASMPVLYVAVGRRLGYPLKLVAAQGKCGHLFCRWDEPGGERFNIEATNEGLSCHPDEFYRTGLFEFAGRNGNAERFGLLKSMTPREEVARFLRERGFCWKEAGNFSRAVEAFGWAWGASPSNQGLGGCFAIAMDEWHAQLQKLAPPGFPPVVCNWPRERWLPATVPWHLERDMLSLWAAQTILMARDNEQNWWGPMRRGERPPRKPIKANVCITPDGFEVGYHLIEGSS
jgi:hypothetical protein